MTWSVFETGLTLSEAAACLNDIAAESATSDLSHSIQPTLLIPNRGFRNIFLFSAFDILHTLIAHQLSIHLGTMATSKLMAEKICGVFYNSLAELSDATPNESKWQQRFGRAVLKNWFQAGSEQVLIEDHFALSDIEFIENCVLQCLAIIEWMNSYLKAPSSFDTDHFGLLHAPINSTRVKNFC